MIKLDESFREKDIFNKLPFSAFRFGLTEIFVSTVLKEILPIPWISIFIRIWSQNLTDPTDQDSKHCLSVN